MGATLANNGSIPRLGLPRAKRAVLAMLFGHFVIHAGFQAGKSGAAYSGTSEVAQGVWTHQITKMAAPRTTIVHALEIAIVFLDF
jgi:hypothetical protein